MLTSVVFISNLDFLFFINMHEILIWLKRIFSEILNGLRSWNHVSICKFVP